MIGYRYLSSYRLIQISNSPPWFMPRLQSACLDIDITLGDWQYLITITIILAFNLPCTMFFDLISLMGHVAIKLQFTSF